MAAALGGCERFEAPSSRNPAAIAADVTVVTGPDRRTVLFVRDRAPRDRSPQPAMFQGGQLRFENGCLVLDGALVVWPRDARLDLSTPGRIAVIDQGQTAAVGGYLSVTGPRRDGRIDDPALAPCAAYPVHVLNGFKAISSQRYRGTLPPGPPPPSPPPAPPQIASEAARSGRYLVEAIDERPPPPHTDPIEVTIGPGDIRARSQCKSFGWSTPTPPGVARPHPGPPPRPQPECLRNLTEWEEAFRLRVNALRGASWRSNGTLLWAGDEGTVTLRPAP